MWAWDDSAVVMSMVCSGDVTADVDVGDSPIDGMVDLLLLPSGTDVSFISKCVSVETDAVLLAVVGSESAIGVVVNGGCVSCVEVASVVIDVGVPAVGGGCVVICECIVGDDATVVDGDCDAEEDNDDDDCSVVNVAAAVAVVGG